MSDGAIHLQKRRTRARGASRAFGALLLLAALPAGTREPRAQAAAPAKPSDKFHITEQEKVACSADAIRFCMHTYPDEDQLLACMKQNRDALTAACRVAFDAGIKRRRL